MTYTEDFVAETRWILERIDQGAIERMAAAIAAVRDEGGRLFVLGNGGGAAHASHAVNDFRTLCGIEAYCPTDNVAELTARANDDGWETALRGWLGISRLGMWDGLLVFSVSGGGPRASQNLVAAVDFAWSKVATVLAIVGPDGGEVAHLATICLRVPCRNGATVYAQTEAIQAVVWHLLATHPALRKVTV